MNLRLFRGDGRVHEQMDGCARGRADRWMGKFGRGDDTVGNPHRAHFFQFELFEPVVLLKLDRQCSLEQFEPTVSQSTVSPPLL